MEILQIISVYALPVIIFSILLTGLYNNIKIYDIFIESAKEGITTIVKIIPPLVGLIVAIGVFRASGAFDLLIFILKPFIKLSGIPPEVVPLAFLRPISGSASLALVSDIIKNYGPDSFIGRTASTMMGSTETIFYTLTVYFGSVGIKNIRQTLVCALIADMVSVAASAWICALLFGG